MDTYKKYKPFEGRWLTRIPEGWDYVPTLRYMSSLVDYRGKTPKKVDEGIFLVTARNIKNGKINYEHSKEYVEDETYEEVMRRGKPQINDILFTTEAPLGEIALVDKVDIALAQRIIKFRPNPEKFNSVYKKYYFQSTFFQQNLLSLATGSTALGIKSSKLCLLRSLKPSLQEQTLIAQFLDEKTSQIDKLIEQKEKLLKLLTEKRTAIITQAVTKGLDPTVEMKDSGIDWLGEIPKHWDVCLLKHKAQISYGLGGEIDTSLTEGTKLLSLPNVNKEGTLILDQIPFADVTEEEAKELILQKGDLLFNWRNGSSDHLGKTAYFDLDGEYLHVSFLLRIRVNKEINNPRFFQYLLHSLRLTGFFTSSKAGVNNTFNQNELRNLWVMVPPLKEQVEISDFISRKITKIDQVRIEIENGIKLLKEYRETLITSAVTGQIDVRK